MHLQMMNMYYKALKCFTRAQRQLQESTGEIKRINTGKVNKQNKDRDKKAKNLITKNYIRKEL
jgi:hypothetical protein